MSEPKSKAEIIKRLETERRRLEQSIASLNPDSMLLPGVVGQSSVKDVLAHLADWEAHMLVWMAAARSGDPVASPDPGLTWEQVNTMNERIYEAHRQESLDEVLGYLRATHQRFMEMVATMPEDEMLTHGRYAFTGKDAVYDWLYEYADHDLWGTRKIREWKKPRSAKKVSRTAKRPSRAALGSEGNGRTPRRSVKTRRVKSS